MRRGFAIHHNGPQMHVVGREHARCEQAVESVRRWHIEGNGWSDEAYSFYVCHHNRILTGRGWDRAQWANGGDERGADDGPDREWYTVLVLVGGGKATGYDTGEPEEPILPGHIEALRRLIQQGRDTGRCGDRVLPHNAFKHKACPAQTLTDLAARWDRQPLYDRKADDDMGYYAFLIEYSYRQAKRDPHKDPNGVTYWLKTLPRDKNGPMHTVNFCRLLLDLEAI